MKNDDTGVGMEAERSDAQRELEISTLSWPEHYSTEDRNAAEQILAWLRNEVREQAWLARRARVNPSLLNQILRGKYPSPPSEALRAALAACKLDAERAKVAGIPFVKGDVARLIWSVCHRARTYRTFGVVTTNVGIGKTRALKEYAAANPNTILIEADPSMSVGALLDELLRATGASLNTRVRGSRGTHQERYRSILDHLIGSDVLLMLDEAETAQPKVLEVLRRLRDKAGIGIVLAGTEYLAQVLKREHGHFGQIRSRTSFWPAHIESISLAELRAVVSGAFPDHTIDERVMEAFRIFSDGSMRVLTESLITAVRDFVLAQGHPMTYASVCDCATTVLGLRPNHNACKAKKKPEVAA